MHQAGFVVPKVRTGDARVEEPGQRLLEPPGSRALRGGDPPRRGHGGRRRRASWCAPACTPAARPTTSSSSRTPETQGPHRLGQDQQADLAGALSRALQPHARLRPAPRAVRARLLGRRRSGAPHRRARGHRDGLAQSVRPQHVPAARRPRSCEGFKPDFTILQPAGLPGRSRRSTAPRRTAPSW